MAPASRGQGLAHRSYSQVNGNGFDLPPSTMAAQLINNLSTPNKPSRHAEQEDLKTLMDEVSNQEASIADFSNAEANLEHKHKLIYVFGRAVLERLAADDPFLDFQKIVPQASDALDIFMSTIKEMPDVLAYCVAPESALLSRGQEPLWFWLFPRALALLGRRQCDALTEKIKDFFYECFQVVARVPKLWTLSSFFFSYLKECAASMLLLRHPSTQPSTDNNLIYPAMLSHLQNPSILSHNHMIDALLPAGEVGPTMFSHDLDGSPSNANLNCTYPIRFASEGISHVANILCMLVDISMATAASYDATPAFQDYMGWMLESFLTAHEQRKRLQDDPSLYESCRKSEITSLCSLHALLSTTKTAFSASIVRKGYTVLSILCSDFIEKGDNLMDHVIHLNLCSSLLSLVAICKEYYSMRRVVTLHLVPAIQLAFNDESRSSTLGKDFKVNPFIAISTL